MIDQVQFISMTSQLNSPLPAAYTGLTLGLSMFNFQLPSLFPPIGNSTESEVCVAHRANVIMNVTTSRHGTCEYVKGMKTTPEMLVVSNVGLNLMIMLLLTIAHALLLFVLRWRRGNKSKKRIPASLAIPRWEILMFNAMFNGACQSCFICLTLSQVGSWGWWLALIAFLIGPVAFLVMVHRISFQAKEQLSFLPSLTGVSFFQCMPPRLEVTSKYGFLPLEMPY